MKNLGFFGGCFNPPTISHIELIEKAIKEYNLDKVYFVPMGDLYKKEQLVPAFHRVNMLKMAIKDNMDILNICIEAEKEMQAIDTFKIIQNKFNSSNNFFIMGSDNYEKIRDWKCADELMQNYQYIILKRENDISSSKAREKIRNGESPKEFIYKDIELYILKNELYK